MRIVIDVAGDDFLNTDYYDNYGCPMCQAARRVIKDSIVISMGGATMSLCTESRCERYPFLEFNGKPERHLNDSVSCVRSQKPFTFTVDIPEEYIKEEYLR